MEVPSFPPRNLQLKFLSEEKPEKNLVFHTGAKLASSVGVSLPNHQKKLYEVHV